MRVILLLLVEAVFLNYFHILFCFRNVLLTSCTAIQPLKSHTRETFKSIPMLVATDGILNLTAMNVVVL